MQVDYGLALDERHTERVVSHVEQTDLDRNSKLLQEYGYAAGPLVDVSQDGWSFQHGRESLPGSTPTKWGSFVAKVRKQ